MNVGDELEIDRIVWRLAEHPSAPGMPYGQEGRQAIVYELLGAGESRALKVFKPRFRVPGLVALADKLAAFADLPGLTVCRRTVLTPQRHVSLLRPNPELTYAVLMPWIDGPTWMEALLSGQELSPEQSLFLARSLADMLSALEQRSVAHCDLSGPNLLLPALVQSTPSDACQAIELVDVEQLHGPGLDRPHILPSGSFGYAHRTALQGLWQPDADRFAGAVLIAEMLGWCDPHVRKAAWGESFFDPSEMQQDGMRYTVLRSALERRWGDGPTRLLDQIWSSDTLADCPTFGEWLLALPEQAPMIAGVSPILSALTMPFAESDLAGAMLGDQALPVPKEIPTGNGVLVNEAPHVILADEGAGKREIVRPELAQSVDELFDAGLAAYQQSDWTKAKELMGEIVGRQPTYTRDKLRASDLLANAERQITFQAQAANGQGSQRRAWAVPILVLLALLTFGGIAVYQAQASATAQAQATATAQALAAAQTQQAGAIATMRAGATTTAIAQTAATFQAQATGTAQSLLAAATATAQAVMAADTAQTVETAEAHAQQTANAVAAFAKSTAEAQAAETVHAQETDTASTQSISATQTAQTQATITRHVTRTESPSTPPTPRPTRRPLPTTAAPTQLPNSVQSAPVQLSPPNGTVFSPIPPGVLLQWSPVPSAVKYWVEIHVGELSDPSGWYDSGPEVATTNYLYCYAGDCEGMKRHLGSFLWRVTGVDANGRIGPRSGWWKFTLAFSP